MKTGILIVKIFFLCVTMFCWAEENIDASGRSVVTATYTVKRLNNGRPLITEKMFLDCNASSKDGKNINGPSVIRVPEWLIKSGKIAAPEARYYLYFAHHQGDYIRMAWSENIEGPYTLYRAGENIPLGTRGVLDLGKDDEIKMQMLDGSDFIIRGHVASPFAVVDEKNKRIVLYFHGAFSGQKTFVATSEDGLNFNLPGDGGQKGQGPRPVAVSHFYLTPFNYKGQGYGFTNYGTLWRSPEGTLITDEKAIHPPYNYRLWSRTEGPIQKSHDQRDDGDGDKPETKKTPRHFAVRFSTFNRDELHVFFSRRDDAPERIVMQKVDLSQSSDWKEWTNVSWPPEEILRPEKEWEGAGLSVKPSENGSASGVNQLRDPHVFEDLDGSVYMFYCGSGEGAIGLVQLVEQRTE